MVIYGHTHRKASNKIGRTIVVNPGTAKGRMVLWILRNNSCI